MHEFSTVDGFAEINESLAEMIKYIANEPSVGLYYIQQHVRNATPNVLNLNAQVLDKSRETALHTEDSEDSIAMVKSMKECGSPIADGMIGDIKNSLALMSSKQPKRGLILNAGSPWNSRSSSSIATPTTMRGSDYSQDTSESGSYFTSVFKSAKEKASNIKWPQLDLKDQKVESSPDVESNEFEEKEEEVFSKGEQHMVEKTKFEEFKAGKEASLKAWLGDMDEDADVNGRATERI
ncbi:unnamed protein product [Eruca vesicaria subsp. sativa]|uniref:Uncharacterized protein n=1 Tax=Eruca vesicaria subsp. sativa TaxID=29727 RepID=A0ABC8M4U3_ERUVS|nr:unnamed protein product [Eruca vesicaria subsp. sativa]